MDDEDDLAPDFNADGGYPSKGERIGPAWQTAWDMMRDGRWHRGRDLADAMIRRVDITHETAKSLLSKARVAGLIEVSYAMVHIKGRGGRMMAHYRRIST